ncbi:MAG: hypothetical protein AAFX39_00550 [Pseudomonadota bacterium]
MTARNPAESDNGPFFVGYINRLPAGLAWFLAAVAAVLVGGMAGAALAIGSTINDPGDGRFEFGLGRQEVTGVLETSPYPVMRIPANADNPEPRAILLAGQGKRGVLPQAEPHSGEVVTLGGVLLKRGTIDMIQVSRQIVPLADAESPDPALLEYTPAPPEPLGRWRLTGEICDGKCNQGAMRPGRGLSHKACANLCLIGGVPAVFVAEGGIDGEDFFLLADADGNAPPDLIYDYVALDVTLEGEVERRDDLLIFKADFSTIRAN